MSRKTWSKDDFRVSYSNGTITAFSNKLIKDSSSIMYFYYDLVILIGKKVVFKASAYDFPKVINIPSVIDYFLKRPENELYIVEDYKNGDFRRKELYDRYKLEDSFSMNCEYYILFERYITYVKQADEKKHQRIEYFTLTFGLSERNKKGYSNGENYGCSVYIENLTLEEILSFKKMAETFVTSCIEEHNQELKKSKIECPKCHTIQNYTDFIIHEDSEPYCKQCVSE